MQFAQQGVAPWDRSLAIETRAAPMDNRRWQLAIIAVVGGLFLFATDVWSDLALQIAQGAPG